MTTRRKVPVNFPNLQSVNAAVVKGLIDVSPLGINNCALRVETLVVIYEPSTGKGFTIKMTRAFAVVSGTVTAFGTVLQTATGDASLSAMAGAADLLVQTNDVCTLVQGLVGKTVNFVIWTTLFTSEI